MNAEPAIANIHVAIRGFILLFNPYVSIDTKPISTKDQQVQEC
ncbi:hypothetical protein P8917_09575 [Bacillus atrophaeus]|nr:hypothetical protein [Bacillus atrophaeus]MEC0748261.1 hypothetical protein [Bacillus atrophaeus]MEC0802645.1 hypothetical protein [Bacillus atrophaeus]MEC0814271.1 hypothetical protein [Bacillus atrophaeus]MEC0816372.1 hypothetical protein [Bacillus atrophaeus]MEC0822689.1 hypothetical protein [Bacillus atrophaeus]